MNKSEFYRDAQRMWRCRRIAPVGKIVGASAEGHNTAL
jgi:hypothetical protein